MRLKAQSGARWNLSFKDILGQDSAVLFLKNSCENGLTSHAFIFAGQAGVGKKLAAVNFAKALNCTASGEKPCDTCVSCRKIDASNHPDIFLLKPEKESSSLGIDKVREIIKNVGLKPYESKKKVYIIDDSASLTLEAQNALLKTVEEPPSDSVIIFIAERPDDLLPTIGSRCQVLKFFPLKAEDIRGILVSVYKLDDTQARVLSRLSAGSLAMALKLNDGKFFDKRSGLIKGLLDGSFFDSDFEGLTKSDTRAYLDTMLTWYRDILITKIAAKSGETLLVNVDRSETIEKEARHMDFDFLDDIIRQIVMTRSFLEQNVNPKLAMGVLGANIIR